MADDLTNRGLADRAHVNVHEDYEVRYWCGKWGCSEAELRAVVGAVGVMVDKIEAHLKGKGQKRK